jgi:hypothetical protein
LGQFYAQADRANFNILACIYQSHLDRQPFRSKALSLGDSTKDVASRFRLSPARVSQLRRELEASWLGYHGEAA